MKESVYKIMVQSYKIIINVFKINGTVLKIIINGYNYIETNNSLFLNVNN